MEFYSYPIQQEVGDARNIISKISQDDKDVQVKELEEDIQNIEGRYIYTTQRLNYMRDLFMNSAKNDSDFQFVETHEKIEKPIVEIESPDIYHSPRKDDDRFTDVESINELEHNENEDEKSRAYTARSFRIQSDECFDTKEDGNRSLESFQWTDSAENTINKSLNENDNFISNYSHSARKPVEIEIIPKRKKKVLETSGILKKSLSHIKTMKSRQSITTKNVKNVRRRQEAAINREIRMNSRKTRFRSAHSKSTTASRTPSILQDKKNSRKQKRRGKRTIEAPKLECERKDIYPLEDKKVESSNERFNNNEERIDEKQIELVELFTNLAARSVQSISVASSHPQFRLETDTPVSLKDKKNIKSPKKIIKPEPKSPTKLPKIDDKFNNSVKPVKKTIEPEQDNSIRREEKFDEKCFKNCHEVSQSTPIRSWYCEPFVPPTYLQPTIASRLKRTNRCYFTARCNFQNIPFVVGTSITRSHNLGLNIQQVLSLIKTRQPNIATEIRPALIKKIGRGLNPAYNLLDSLHEISIKSEEKKKGINLGDSFFSSKYEENLTPMQREEELKRETEMRATTPGFSHEIYRIRNMMIRLHDEFEEINSRYEKIQEQVAKSPDKRLEAEMNELDAELSAKEEEIKAVVALYKELMGKSTMRNNKKIPSTSTRLTGLLRQIQSFQQHLITS